MGIDFNHCEAYGWLVKFDKFRKILRKSKNPYVIKLKNKLTNDGEQKVKDITLEFINDPIFELGLRIEYWNGDKANRHDECMVDKDHLVFSIEKDEKCPTCGASTYNDKLCEKIQHIFDLDEEPYHIEALLAH